LVRGLAILAVLMPLALAGCGFHLRGAVEVPPELSPMHIQAAAGSAVRTAIEDQVRGGSVRLASDASDARLILRILSESRSNRVAAVDANGKILAYELHYLIRFDAVAADGRLLVPPQTLDLIRNFDNPDVEVLGKQLEEEMIYNDLAVDAADRILMRLRAVLL
jgi:LPS-assembly lipoprotein